MPASEATALRVVWSMRVSARWPAAVPNVDIVEGWIIGAAKDKTFAPAQKNLCQSHFKRDDASPTLARHFPFRTIRAPKGAQRTPTGHMGPSVQRLQEPRAEVSARHQRGEIDLLVGGVGALAVGAQAVERRDAERGGEVAVAAAAGQRHVVQLLADLSIERLRLQFAGSIYSRPVPGGLHHHDVRVRFLVHRGKRRAWNIRQDFGRSRG